MTKLKLKFGSVTFAIALLCFIGCIKAPNISDTPTLSFISLSKSVMNQGDLNNDSIIVTLDFTDGDGDIGAPTNGTKPNLTVIDNRNGEIYDNIKLPLIPQEGAGNGVKGTIYLKLYNGCCLFDDRPNCTQSPELSNQLSLDISIEDNAGNKSNVVTTSNIELRCI
jgi:hypothetical protein